MLTPDTKSSLGFLLRISDPPNAAVHPRSLRIAGASVTLMRGVPTQ